MSRPASNRLETAGSFLNRFDLVVLADLSQERQLQVAELQRFGDGAQDTQCVGNPAGLKGTPLGDLHTSQVGGAFNGHSQVLPAALDALGQGQEGFDSVGLRVVGYFSNAYILITPKKRQAGDLLYLS